MLDVSSLPAEPFLFLCRELSDRSQCETVQFDMLFDVHLWVLSFTTQRKASPCHLLGVMAGITQLANSCSSAGCGLMHLASEACTALLEITLSCATVRNSKHTACSVGDVPFFSGRAAAFRRARSSMHARKQAVLLLKSMGTCERTLLGSISRYQAFMVEL
jgi:hypothetical protein